MWLSDPAVGCGEDEGPQGVTSQMVLLCSWRTVKEVSLLLGHLAEEATIAISSEGEVIIINKVSGEKVVFKQNLLFILFLFIFMIKKGGHSSFTLLRPSS